MKNRTKFVILAIVSLYATFFANVLLSAFGKEQLSDGYCIAWIGAFTTELGLLFGLKLSEDKNSGV